MPSNLRITNENQNYLEQTLVCSCDKNVNTAPRPIQSRDQAKSLDWPGLWIGLASGLVWPLEWSGPLTSLVSGLDRSGNWTVLGADWSGPLTGLVFGLDWSGGWTGLVP